MATQKLTYSEAINELEQILSRIEHESPDIDTLSKDMKRAATLIKFCRAKLKGTEEQINKILKEFENEQNE